ncbi:MAG: TolC family protein [Anaerotignum sp.]|nr:TolC family protein [Anaerotignum sp.]
MKAFLYKAKGALALALAMSMFGTQVFAAEALSAEAQGVQAPPVVELTEEEIAAQTIPTLTYEEALSKAKKNSAALRDLEDLTDVLREERNDQIDDLGTLKTPTYEYKKWVNFGTWAKQAQVFATKMEQESTALQRDLQNLVIEVSVKSSFVDILGQQDQIELAKKNAEMQQKLYEQAQVKYRLGMLSKYGTGGLDEMRIAAEQAKNNVALAEASLTQTYTNFNRLLGEPESTRYDLVYDVTYEPYEIGRPLDMYISDKMNNDDLSLKLMELSVEGAKFTSNYLPDEVPAGVTDPYDNDDRHEYSLDSAERSLKTAKQEKESLIQNTYLQIKQLETMRDSAEADLKKAETTYRMVEVNYQAGNVTKTAVEQAEMGVISAQNALKTNAYNHDMLVFTFENPSLLSSSAQ